MIDAQAGLQSDTLVLHACFAEGSVHLWAESAARFAGKASEGAPASGDGDGEIEAKRHPYAVPSAELSERFGTGSDSGRTVRMRLPADGSRPLPSDSLDFAIGRGAELGETMSLGEFVVETIAVPFAKFRGVFDTVLSGESDVSGGAESDSDRLVASDSVEFFATLGLFAHHLLAQQRFLPMLYQD